MRTNQLDIPLSRLQVKTMSRTLPPLPRLSNTVRRNTLPSASSTVPNINVEDSSFKKENSSPIASSPPRLHESHEPATTPILPRQRQSLLNPPNLESPIWALTPEKCNAAGGDLTSSVVKGRAADGLLSLMGAR